MIGESIFKKVELVDKSLDLHWLPMTEYVVDTSLRYRIIYIIFTVNVKHSLLTDLELYNCG